ncbi:unnamed protein product, partial [Prorocentrum cordatum]
MWLAQAPMRELNKIQRDGVDWQSAVAWAIDVLICEAEVFATRRAELGPRLERRAEAGSVLWAESPVLVPLGLLGAVVPDCSEDECGFVEVPTDANFGSVPNVGDEHGIDDVQLAAGVEHDDGNDYGMGELQTVGGFECEPYDGDARLFARPRERLARASRTAEVPQHTWDPDTAPPETLPSERGDEVAAAIGAWDPDDAPPETLSSEGGDEAAAAIDATDAAPPETLSSVGGDEAAAAAAIDENKNEFEIAEVVARARVVELEAFLCDANERLNAAALAIAVVRSGGAVESQAQQDELAATAWRRAVLEQQLGAATAEAQKAGGAPGCFQTADERDEQDVSTAEAQKAGEAFGVADEGNHKQVFEE